MSGVRQHSSDWQEQLKEVKADLFSEDVFKGGYTSNRHRRKSKHSKERNPFEGVTFQKEVSNIAVNNIGDSSSGLGPGPLGDPELSFGFNRSEVAWSKDADVGAFMADNRDQSSFGEGDYEAETRRNKFNREGDPDRYDRDLTSRITRIEEELLRRKLNEIQQAKNRKVEKAAVWGSLVVGTFTVVAGAVVLIVGMLGDHKSNIMNL
jgi:hypothetical protein